MEPEGTVHYHMSLSWASSIQSIPPHPTSWRSILILSSHLRLGLPSGLFPSGFPTKTLYTPLLSPIRATFPAHLILLYSDGGYTTIQKSVTTEEAPRYRKPEGYGNTHLFAIAIAQTSSFLIHTALLSSSTDTELYYSVSCRPYLVTWCTRFRNPAAVPFTW